MVSAAVLDCRGASDAQVWPEAAHKRMIEPGVEQTANEIVVAVPGEDDRDTHNTRNSDNDPLRVRASRKDVPRKNLWRWIVPLLLLVAVIVVLVVDLALKPEPADIDHNWVSLRQFSVPTTNSSSSPALNSSRLLLVLETVLVISNPNLVGRFQYYDGGVYLFYHGRQAGHALIPSGVIPTQRSRNLSALVSTNSEALVQAEEDAVLPFSTETNMTGFVRTWAVFKQHFQIASVCEVLLSMQSHTLVRYSCHDK